MTRSPKHLSHPSLAYKLRGFVALLGIAGIALALFGAAASIYHAEYVSLAVLLVLILAQVALLSPRQNWTTHIATSSRPMRRTLIIASAMFAILSFGLVMIAIDGLGLWHDFTKSQESSLRITFGALAILWLFWTSLFLFLRDWGPRYLRLRKLVYYLIAGSLLESIIATGVLAFTPDPDDCICARGSFLGLFLSGCVALWAFGPATILVFWERKAQREFLRRRCEDCKRRLAKSMRAGFDHCRHCNAPIPAAVLRKTRYDRYEEKS